MNTVFFNDMRKLVQEKLEKHKSFVTYTWVGIIVTVLTIVISSLLIDLFKLPALLVNSVVIGGFFILKYFLYKWAGFAK